MGSLISPSHLSKVDDFVKRAATISGLEILTGGLPLLSKAFDNHDFSSGSFYPPTVIAGQSLESINSETSIWTRGQDETKIRSSEIWKEEIFGPVVVLIPFEDEEHAIELANDSQFGLGSGIWTEDVSTEYGTGKSVMTPWLPSSLLFAQHFLFSLYFSW